jgi:DNA-binding transcriptional regulator YiaG
MPGGLAGMLTLGWLSGDPKAGAVRKRWCSLPREVRNRVEVEDLCQAVGIDPGEFFGLVATTAYRLGMDVSEFIGGAMRMFDHSIEFVQQVASGGAGRTMRFPRSAPKSNQRNHRGSRACHEMAAFRKKLRLAARQFAKIFGVGLRIVQAWEAGECNPAPPQQCVLELLRRYVKQNGAKVFREHFVKEPARYGRCGRPAGDPRRSFASR